jgi:rubrerythrin
MKATKHWLKEQIKDEKMASKMYRKHGFPQIAKDERKHMRILKKRLKKVGV